MTLKFDMGNDQDKNAEDAKINGSSRPEDSGKLASQDSNNDTRDSLILESEMNPTLFENEKYLDRVIAILDDFKSINKI